MLKIATAADFCGTRWQNSAVITPMPKGHYRAYLQPVARAMRLYRHHIGSHAIKVLGMPDGLEVVASRRGDSVYLHVANIQRTRSVNTTIQSGGHVIRNGRVLEITADRAVELSYLNRYATASGLAQDKPIPQNVGESGCCSGRRVLLVERFGKFLLEQIAESGKISFRAKGRIDFFRGRTTTS